MPQTRRVRGVVRKVDAWTVLRFAALFHLSLLVVVLVAGVLLWTAAAASGVLDGLETFVQELFALETFRFLGGTIFRAALLGGLVMVLLGTGLSVLAAVLYNLISDIVGGVEVVVLEQEPAPRSVV